MDANSVLINALGAYLIVDIPDLKGDTTSRVNAVLRCNEYLLHNTVTTDWVKRNWVIMMTSITLELLRIKKILQSYMRNMIF